MLSNKELEELGKYEGLVEDQVNKYPELSKNLHYVADSLQATLVHNNLLKDLPLTTHSKLHESLEWALHFLVRILQEDKQIQIIEPEAKVEETQEACQCKH